MFSIVAPPICIPINSVLGYPFINILANVCYWWSFGYSYGETVETVSDFILGGSKITADGDGSHEIKTLTCWKESYDKPR